MKRLMLLSSALILTASMSFAAVTANDLVTAYQAKGYTRIEVKTGLTQIKVEAVKGNTKVEVIYDAASGAILDQETSRAARGDRGTGVEISTEARDFLSGGGSSDDNGDDNGDDANDDDGPHHDAGDDDHGSDDGDDDGSDDDNDNQDDDAGDDDGDDDHGGDRDHKGHGQSGKDD